MVKNTTSTISYGTTNNTNDRKDLTTPMKTRFLTKTKYLLGSRCTKSLQYQLRHPEYSNQFGEEKDYSELQPAYELSKEYYPNCKEVVFDGDFESAFKKTKELIDIKTETIANAMFCTDTNEMCMVRLMHLNKQGVYDIFNIQLKRPDSDRREKVLKVDGLGYMYQVVKRCGISVGNLYVMHINYDYVRNGELNAREYFKLFDCTEAVYEMQPKVKGNIKACWESMNAMEEVERDRDYQCIQPKADACEFCDHCFSDIPKNSILNISRLLPKKALPLIESGIITANDIVNAGVKLSKLQKMQAEAEAYGLPPHVDTLNLREFLGGLTYPLYHLDFETYNEPVPQYDGERPWDQVPFQYSLHVQESKGAEPKHYEFLAERGIDPRRGIAEALCRDIPKDVCVTAYHMSFEQKRLEELAGLYPDLAAHLLNIRDNIHDLEVPFSKRYYYCKELEGKSSIKKVLPTLCPGDPELDYSSLEGVHRGDEASQAYKDMQKQSCEESEETKRQLLQYCRLDTLAMVKVLERLYEILDKEVSGEAA